MSEKIGLAIRIWREREKPVWIVYADARTSYLYIYMLNELLKSPQRNSICIWHGVAEYGPLDNWKSMNEMIYTRFGSQMNLSQNNSKVDKWWMNGD